ncbi:JAB domain-containing protein [Pedobacter sp. Leaf194]|uniref:JAB domain-containing protein n=1 Tax=Pedobacter sp. Leaf194 TaxID=1736297 RepID=UPI000702A5AB|nr:JAB domain-containing protein [Pedobacter sp. Leaf194]KQS36833.1 DNA repair protein [Pedobacter sp. Leaf194]
MENALYQLAEIEISYKPKFKASQRPEIDCSLRAYHVLLSNWNLDRIELLEEFKILLLNRRNEVLGMVNISQGGISGTVADAKIIFAIALKACASGIILSHNHPSGESDASEADIALTRRLVEVGKLLEIKLLDHIIVCPDTYLSFKDEGIM